MQLYSPSIIHYNSIASLLKLTWQEIQQALLIFLKDPPKYCIR